MVVVGKRRRETRRDCPGPVDREDLPEGRYSLRVLDLVQWRLERYGGFERRRRLLLVASTCELQLEPLVGADLVQPESDGKARRDRRVVVALESAPMPEEVHREKTRGLEDVHDPVRVL